MNLASYVGCRWTQVADDKRHQGDEADKKADDG